MNRQLLKTLWEKEKRAISPFSPQCFLLYQISVSPFVHISDIISLFAVELKESKTGILFTNVKVLAVTKLKTQDKINVTNITIALFDRVENTMGKGENAGYTHFPLFPQCFQLIHLKGR